MRQWLVILFGVLALVAGCGSSGPDDHDYAAAVCVDPNGFRMPDTYCPIGDGITNQGYGWVYREYRDDTPDVDVVYVGYPVDTHVWVHDRPRRVPTLNIDRGRFPERPVTVSTAGATSARVVTIAEERKPASAVVRGGLGVSKGGRNAEAPQPNRTLDSPAPGRKIAATPAPLPPPPAKRVVAPATKKKAA